MVDSVIGDRETESDRCDSDNDGDDCAKRNEDVQRAKKKVRRLGSYRFGMSRYELEQRKAAWLDEATARARRDEKCFNGGDFGHQEAHANAWRNVGKCTALLQ